MKNEEIIKEKNMRKKQQKSIQQYKSNLWKGG